MLLRDLVYPDGGESKFAIVRKLLAQLAAKPATGGHGQFGIASVNKRSGVTGAAQKSRGFHSARRMLALSGDGR
jgi:hypothetical protein